MILRYILGHFLDDDIILQLHSPCRATTGSSSSLLLQILELVFVPKVLGSTVYPTSYR